MSRYSRLQHVALAAFVTPLIACVGLTRVVFCTTSRLFEYVQANQYHKHLCVACVKVCTPLGSLWLLKSYGVLIFPPEVFWLSIFFFSVDQWYTTEKESFYAILTTWYDSLCLLIVTV